MITRDLVDLYLRRRLTRRGFAQRLAQIGFSAAAASSLLQSLAPWAAAEEVAPAAGAGASSVSGTGGVLLVEQLRAAGTRFIFNCNSSRTSPVLDALVDRTDMQLIQATQEGQMTSIAQGYALASGQVAFTLCGGVGFPNTLNNMYNAWKDRSPLLLGTQREARQVQGGRDAFEEWDDFLAPSASFTRWRWSVDAADRIPEFTRRAFRIAATDPQGPVALAFPTDVLSAPASAAILPRDKFLITPDLRPASRAIEEVAKMLLAARMPVIVVGAEVSRANAARDVVRLAEMLGLPVSQGDRLFADFPTQHPLFAGDLYGPILAPAQPDLIVSLGARLTDTDDAIPSGAKIAQISIDPDNIGRVVPADIGIVAGAREAATDLIAALESAATSDQRAAIRERLRAPVREIIDARRARQTEHRQRLWDVAPMSWERIGGELEQLLDSDAIIVSELDSSGYLGLAANAVLAQLTFGPDAKTRIGKTTGSALGWGVGAALGVKLAQPDRQVVALQGDGSFLFSQAETLWTMARYEMPVITVILNNRSYDGPRDRVFRGGGRQAETGRDMSCYLGDPDVDFVGLAASFGVAGERVQHPDELRPALQRAIQRTREGKPCLLDVLVARTGFGAESSWYPKYSVAASRTRSV